MPATDPDPAPVLLDCTNCDDPQDWDTEQTASDGGRIVTCDGCGKRHGETNLFVDVGGER